MPQQHECTQAEESGMALRVAMLPLDIIIGVSTGGIEYMVIPHDALMLNHLLLKILGSRWNHHDPLTISSNPVRLE